jgi:hypothetical protein
MTQRDPITGRFVSAMDGHEAAIGPARDAMAVPHVEPVKPSPGYAARQYDAFMELMPQDEIDGERWPAGWWIVPVFVLGAAFWVVLARAL